MVQLSTQEDITQANEEFTGNELIPIKSDRNITKIDVKSEKNSDWMNLEASLSSPVDRAYSLQTRSDPLTAIIGVSGAGGIAYMVANNLSNLEVFVKNVWHLVLKRCFKQGEKLPNGGCKSLDGKSITWRGEIIEFVNAPVHVFVISPANVYQKIVIVGQRVFVNDVLLVQNTAFNEELLPEPTYRKTGNSFWHTNLPVGDPMTEKDIIAFRQLQWEVEQERDKAIKGVLAVAAMNAERLTKTMGPQKDIAMELALNSFKRTGSSDGKSDGYDSGYESVLTHLQDGTYDMNGPTGSVPHSPDRCGTFSVAQWRGSDAARPNTHWAKLAGAVKLLKTYISIKNCREMLATRSGSRPGTAASPERAKSSGCLPGSSGCAVFPRSKPRPVPGNPNVAGSP